MQKGLKPIHTRRLVLTEMRDSDYDVFMRLYREVRSDTIRRMLDDPEMAAVLNERLWKDAQTDTVNFMIRDQSGEVIGRVCMQHVSEEIPEVGIDLFEAFQGQRYGPEAVSAFIDWYKKEFGVPTVKVCIERENGHSIHVFKKLGAVYVGDESIVRQETVERVKKLIPDVDVSKLKEPKALVFHI